MIGSLSEQIAKWLKSKKIIEAEDVDVCGYGIFWLLNIIEFLLVSVILGFYNIYWGISLVLRRVQKESRASNQSKCELSRYDHVRESVFFIVK